VLRLETVYAAKRAEFLNADRTTWWPLARLAAEHLTPPPPPHVTTGTIAQLRAQVSSLSYQSDTNRARHEEVSSQLAASTKEVESLRELGEEVRCVRIPCQTHCWLPLLLMC